MSLNSAAYNRHKVERSHLSSLLEPHLTPMGLPLVPRGRSVTVRLLAYQSHPNVLVDAAEGPVLLAVSMECSTKLVRPISKVPLEYISPYFCRKWTIFCLCSQVISAGNFSRTNLEISDTNPSLPSVFGGFRAESFVASITSVTGSAGPKHVPADNNCRLLVVLATHTKVCVANTLPDALPDHGARVAITSVRYTVLALTAEFPP